MTSSEESATRVAVTGMAVRVPGCGGDLDGFWSALAGGRELLTRAGSDNGAAHGVVPDGDLFDADFFGYAPSEARLMDPQQRIFLECAWEALEHAGHAPGAGAHVVGVYAGCGDTGHLERLRAHRNGFAEVSDLQLHLASSVDFLTARVAYKLGLTGPACTVQAACATGLVAVHTATQALLAGECDMALAGGITLHVPFPHDQVGEDGIVAPDGHCRAYDADARGTVVSDGAGVVVLKRLDDALADGDHVHAVILGSAVTNDGADKVGFTAPSVGGVAAAADAALVLAGVQPSTVDYVEGHGTGTPAGDPIELRGLAKAYGGADSGTELLLGSVKSNIGHTDVAAGVLGLIKVVLAMRHETVPATLHFRTPNPAGDLAGSPFQVNAGPVPWPRRAGVRRAGVNSLGLGGTNAHVILEEAPAPAPAPPAGRPQLLPVSAGSHNALGNATARLGTHLGANPDAALGDVAWTLQAGRRPHAYRDFVVAADAEAAARELSAGTGQAPRPAPPLPPDVVFLFSGHGGQHTGMAAELYARWPRFREDLDTCAELAAPRLGFDLREVLFPDEDDEAAVRRAGKQLATMAVGQPAVFAVEYAFAALWRSFGVEPATVAGHSLGAYAAATTAGVLSCADAVLLVTERGRLMDEMPAGAMLAVSAPAERIRTRLGQRLSVAAVNGPAQCVVAGPVDAVEALRAELADEGVEHRRLHISAAAHSPLVEPALDTFRERVRSVRLAPPALTWISDSTGRPVSAQEATDPEYWVRHMRRTVNFAAVLDTVLGPADGLAPAALVEVGPGRTLSGLARQYLTQSAAGDERVVVPSMPHVADPTPGAEVLLTAVGRLWQAGVPVTWSELHPDERLRRVPLPTYPFEPRRFRLDGDEQPTDDTGRRAALPAPRAERSAPVRPAGDTAPGDTSPGDTEAVVAAAYSTILGLDQVDRHRDFFELGGDSLLAARVATILRRELGGDIGVRAVFGAPTVARLAEAIDRRRDAAS